MLQGKRREWLKNIKYLKKSGIFLLPMLQTPIYSEGWLIDVGFVQMGFPQIVISFDNVDDVPLKEDVHRLSMNYCYVDSEYGDEDKELHMFFDVPKEFKKDFELFTQGKYSEFSDRYKKILVDKYGNTRERGLSPKSLLPKYRCF